MCHAQHAGEEAFGKGGLGGGGGGLWVGWCRYIYVARMNFWEREGRVGGGWF